MIVFDNAGVGVEIRTGSRSGWRRNSKQYLTNSLFGWCQINSPPPNNSKKKNTGDLGRIRIKWAMASVFRNPHTESFVSYNQRPSQMPCINILY